MLGAAYFVAFAAIGSPDTVWARAVSYFPVTAPLAMPNRIAMGAAAAHALDLAGSGSVHQIDTAALRKRLHDNLERNDPQPRSELSAEEQRHAEEKKQTERTHA